MSSVTARRAKAISLIKAGLIHSQSDLVKQLKKAGYPVTQATASRDLEEIGAVRGRNAAGDSVYKISDSDDESISRTMPVPSDLIISVESSGNLAVVRTPPGGAQLLASSLDHSGINDIIGTIAVIKYFGFDFMGQQLDEIDGPEDIYEMSKTDFMSRWSNSDE